MSSQNQGPYRSNYPGRPYRIPRDFSTPRELRRYDRFSINREIQTFGRPVVAGFPPEYKIPYSDDTFFQALFRNPNKHLYQWKLLQVEIDGVAREARAALKSGDPVRQKQALDRLRAYKHRAAAFARMFKEYRLTRRAMDGTMSSQMHPRKMSYGETLSRHGYRGTKRRAANSLARRMMVVINYFIHLYLSVERHLPGGEHGRIAQTIFRYIVHTSRLFIRFVSVATDLLDYTFIVGQFSDAFNAFQRWWNRDAYKEIQQEITKEYYKNIPVPEPVFEPKGSDDYAKALREYALYSKRELRDILINSAVGVAVYAGRRGLIRKSTRATTSALKQQTRKYYNAPTEEGGIRIQRILAAASKQIGRDVRIPDKKEARRYVSKAKVKPLTRSRAIYYQAGWFQMAEALGKYQKHGKKKFKYRGQIQKGLGTAQVTPKFRFNHVVTMKHHGAWARQSAQIAIEEALKNEVKGKMAQIKKRQEKGWRQMRTK